MLPPPNKHRVRLLLLMLVVLAHRALTVQGLPKQSITGPAELNTITCILPLETDLSKTMIALRIRNFSDSIKAAVKLGLPSPLAYVSRQVPPSTVSWKSASTEVVKLSHHRLLVFYVAGQLRRPLRACSSLQEADTPIASLLGSI